MLKVIILICHLGMNGSDCNIHNADQVFHGPDAPTQQQCLQNAAYTASQAAKLPDPKTEYVKYVCARPQDVQQSETRAEMPAN